MILVIMRHQNGIHLQPLIPVAHLPRIQRPAGIQQQSQATCLHENGGWRFASIAA